MRALVSLAMLAMLVAPGAEAARITYVPEPALAKMSERHSVAVSPDGRHVYFLGGVDARTGIAIVSRDPATGALSRAVGKEACVITWIAHTSCRPGPAFNNTRAMAVAPDSRDVAVGGYAVTQVALYGRTAAGGLALRSCVGVTAGAKCTAVRGLALTLDLAFSPDGRYLYAATDRSTGALVAFRRDAASGALQQLPGLEGCLQRTGILFPATPPCGSVPAAGFQPAFVRVSPDGASVLVVSQSQMNPGFFVFGRDATTGALTLRTCFTKDPMPPCAAPPVAAQGIDGLAFAPDGRTIVAVQSDYGTDSNRVLGRIDVLRLDPATAALTSVACYEAGKAGCRAIPVPDGAESVVITADGRTAYVGGESVRAYSVSSAGLVAAPGCAGQGRGCTPLGLPGFDRFESLAVSPDARWLYGAGSSGIAFRLG